MLKIANDLIKFFNRISILLIIFFCATLVLIGGCSSNQAGRHKAEEVQIKGVTFKLELALTPEERAEGLMGREEIASDGGMLFVFPDQPPYPADLGFWMKNCLVPIDVIFLDPAGRVVAVREMDPPLPGTPDHELPHYRSDAPAQFAIELIGGRAAELGVKEGDLIELRCSELLKMAQ